MPKLAAALLAATVLAAAPAAAQEAAASAAQAARIAPEGLEYMVGSWAGEGKDPASGETFSFVYRVEPEVGGAWITGYGESKEAGFKSRDIWGREPKTGEIIRVIFNDGGGYATVRSPGWNGDTLVLEGESYGRTGSLRLRETITRISPSEFEAVWEAFQNGKWTPYSIERVTRQKVT
ncbi:MAG TPA: hypothetical protein VF699_10880 [Caulobacteraceae bacterium]|jgi:hypothetical protein